MRSFKLKMHQIHFQPGIRPRPRGDVTKHRTSRTSPKYGSVWYKKDRIDVFSQLTPVMQALAA